MDINGISGMLNNKIRLSGMASGLDTDTIIEQLMEVEKTKVNSLYKQKKALEWKRDNYREMTNLLRGLKDEYFDVLKPSSNLRSSSAFSAFNTTYSGSTSSAYLTATAGSTAKAGTYTISNIQTALAAKSTSTVSLTAPMVGSEISSFAINAASDNNKLTMTLNGASQTITIADNPANVDALILDLQGKINTAFGAGKVTVGKEAGTNKLTFSTSGTNTFSVGNAYNSGISTILGTAVTSAVTLDSQNNRFKVTFGATTQDIVLATGTYNTSYELQSELQSKINAAFGASPEEIRVLNDNNVLSIKAIGSTSVSTTGTLAGTAISDGLVVDSSNKELRITLGTDPEKVINIDENATGYTRTALLANIQSKLDSAYGANKVMVSLDGSNQLRFESLDSTTPLTTAAKENGGLSALGLSNANTSNKTKTNSYLYDIRNSFGTALSVTGAVSDIQFSINGQSFSFSSRTDSLNSIITKVNNDTKANVIMEYSELYDKITIRSKSMGATAKVEISETSGNLLLGSLGLSASSSGRDASITYNDGSGAGDQTIIRSTNSFTVSGIAFELKQDNAGPVSLAVAADTTKIVDVIKGFVTKYNDVISKINTELTEERDRDYIPLTDDEKEAMSDDEVTIWEAKAKSGNLRGDSLLSGILNNMRTALYESIYADSTNESSKLSISLSSIGITTSSSYTDRGKLVIDETKLKEAISNSPDDIVQLFTKDDSGITYNDGLSDGAKRTERYKESGLAQRLYDILQDATRTSRDSNGKKGSLLEKAGMIGDISEFTNMMYDEINDYDSRIDILNDKLLEKENKYYAKFTAMERMLSQMNSQSSWISSQLGS